MPARMLCFALLLIGFVPATLLAQASDGAAAEAEAPATAGEKDDFDKMMGEWKVIITELRRIQQAYRLAPEKDLPKLRKEYSEVLDQGMALLPKIEDAAVQRLKASPDDQDAKLFLAKVLADALEKDDYPRGYRLVHLLLDNGFDENELLADQVVAAFGTDHFEEAETAFKKLKEKMLPIDDRVGQNGVMATELKEKWAREEELRKKEAEADDLPRVKMSTSQGDMVIELYENEAPDTVGNFVNLVEKKFYDGLPFHRVLPHFMAQGGDPQGDGSGGPGYHIFCECYNKDARDHFSGTLSMAHAGKNTGGSQFFLTFQATPHLDGKHTVFGRVIEGKDVLSKLTRREPGGLSVPTADRILKAEVIRKRDHQYVPNKAP
ncbi:putative peptidyl-prolyl cis-trans isomerase [Bremerella volcania]|uniref:peptidylprolyl isomerase n=1 Tax=Bremerella volcania TaxID=2527984 RepID=A0A518CFI0_9BACT|nr:peptidylprolyl isomerase [Bremerella volcania]QDU77989.1 putative peptidyl-prolyl cis-trans isomerase [Bremerella volcania]